MTHSPDRNRKVSCFRHIFPLLAAVVTIAAFATPAQAIERAPAEFVGEFRGSCKDFDGKAFFDVGLGECYKCPGAKPHRSVFDVKGGKYNGERACFRKASKRYARAERKRKATGPLKTKCSRKGEYLWPSRRACYACPKGFKKTGVITTGRACSKRISKSYGSAEFLGERGCPVNSWRHGTSDKCYRCPKGSVRNLKIGSPDSIDACTFLSKGAAAAHEEDIGLEELKARFEAERHEDQSTQARLDKLVRDLQFNVNGCQGRIIVENQLCAHRVRLDMMKQLLEDEAEEGTGFATATWAAGQDFGVGVGVTATFGESLFAYTMYRDDNGNFTCNRVYDRSSGFASGSTGLTLSENITLGRGKLDDAFGGTTGYALSGVTHLFGLAWSHDTGAKSIIRGLDIAVDPDPSLGVGGAVTESETTQSGAVGDCEDVAALF